MAIGKTKKKKTKKQTKKDHTEEALHQNGLPIQPHPQKQAFTKKNPDMEVGGGQSQNTDLKAAVKGKRDKSPPNNRSNYLPPSQIKETNPHNLWVWKHLPPRFRETQFPSLRKRNELPSTRACVRSFFEAQCGQTELSSSWTGCK